MRKSTFVKVWIIAMGLITLFVPLTEAHPHIFITPKAVVALNNHFVSQVDVEWDFDDMSSSLFLESCGSNTDQIWDLVFADTQVLSGRHQTKRSAYYLNVEIDGMPISNLRPNDFKANFVNGNLQCRFTLYINQIVDHSFKIWFDDPTIYNSFDTQQGNFQIADQSGAGHVFYKQTENDIDKMCVSF